MTASAEEAGRIHLELDGPVARITFDRPAARNAMTWRMYEELAVACAALARNSDIRVAVLRGAGGKAFVAGTDIEQFRAFTSGEDGITYEQRIDSYIAALQALPIPTIAVVEGWAVGGGMAIANACDIRIATPGARFGVPIARTLGNCLSAANLRRLTATLGAAMVTRMMLLAEMPMAEEMPPGYVSVVDAAGLDAHIAGLCETITAHAPITMRVSKEALRRLQTDPAAADEDLIRAAYGSEDFGEGVAAFTAKRPPHWRGR